MFGPFQGNDIVFIWADLGFSATRECDLRVEDGPRVEHPKGETRLTHGVSLLVMSSSLSAPWTPACVGVMFVTRPSSQMRHIRVSASSGKMLLGQSYVWAVSLGWLVLGRMRVHANWAEAPLRY
ncbi:hypothetical protein Tco_1134739 [Tanacetum coccineum]